MDPEDTKLFGQTFFPYATAARDRVIQNGGRFAYYTTAATAIQIIRNREIWMRNTAIMNDFMEVKHGVSCLSDAYQSPAGRALDSSLDECFPALSAEIRQLFSAWIPVILRDTFVTSFSEHTAEEDLHGRLSMWRAYGASAGVALVLNGGPMFRPSDVLGAYSSPVAYLDSSGVIAQFEETARRISANAQFVRRLGRDGVKNALFSALRFAAVCTKHPAFLEEREWRVIASPSMHSSPLLSPQVEVVGTIPQLVLKIRLEDHPQQGLYGLNLGDFIDRILIGPCEHPDVVQRALHQTLAAEGISDPDSRIMNTRIPLRTNQR